ncbi:hypothetical protein FBF48_10280 [Streptococcus salivarius]|uniref:Uncharacterized protein n=1 Tax=Streptococcus salivarius TaxID=1304 RepID=A0AAX2V010_STRSL|nr:major capsid protein [Streptococcus salivarius]TNF65775.1 hypothetical protein FBF48_10280 [Streptococcus salivarius]
MFFTQANFERHPALLQQAMILKANRDAFRVNQVAMLAQHSAVLAVDAAAQWAANQIGGISRDYWAQIDRLVVEMRDQEFGMDILNDLLTVQTTLDIGKTARFYNMVGDIADDVAVSIDGQSPFSWDHTDYNNDGDPVPVFTAGFGVNWRHNAGLGTVGLNLILDSQRAKMNKFNKKLVDYLLNGSARINVDGKAGQGLTNHRHTVKLNLSASGAGALNIDLTTATPQQLIDFFTTGPFGAAMRANGIKRYSKLWVSPEIWANLSRSAGIVIGGTEIVNGRSVLQEISPFVAVDSIEQSYALSGNQILAYVRRSDYVTPLVGMATSVVPKPRFMPQENYNFQIMGAMGVQVLADAEGRSGVLWGANLTG